MPGGTIRLAGVVSSCVQLVWIASLMANRPMKAVQWPGNDAMVRDEARRHRGPAPDSGCPTRVAETSRRHNLLRPHWNPLPYEERFLDHRSKHSGQMA